MWQFMIPALLQTGLGIGQMIKSGQYGNTPRPTQQIPPAMMQALGLAMADANQTEAPGSGIARQDIGGATSQALEQTKQSGSAADVLGSIDTIQSNENKAILGLAGQNNAYKTNSENMVKNLLLQKAQAEQANFDYNEKQPYEIDAQTKSSLVSGGLNNAMGGISSGIGNIMSYKMMMDMYKPKSTGGLGTYDNIYENSINTTVPQYDPNNFNSFSDFFKLK